MGKKSSPHYLHGGRSLIPKSDCLYLSVVEKQDKSTINMILPNEKKPTPNSSIAMPIASSEDYWQNLHSSTPNPLPSLWRKSSERIQPAHLNTATSKWEWMSITLWNPRLEPHQRLGPICCTKIRALKQRIKDISYKNPHWIQKATAECPVPNARRALEQKEGNSLVLG